MSVKVTPKAYLEAQEKAMQTYIDQRDASQLQALSRRILHWFNDQNMRGVAIDPMESYKAGLLTAMCDLEAKKIRSGDDLIDTIKEMKK